MCAVVGLIETASPEGGGGDGGPSLAEDAHLALTALQHRGQDASGMAAFAPAPPGGGRRGAFRVRKGPGLVREVFRAGDLDGLGGSALVAHNRYATVGREGDPRDAQPLVADGPPAMAAAHNGNALNIRELSDALEGAGRPARTGSDLERILGLLGMFLREPSWEALARASGEVMDRVNGSYSLVGYVEGLGLFALRDPHGVRPLVLGRRGARHCVASETGGLDFAGFAFVRDVLPGECLLIGHDGGVRSAVLREAPRAHCMFEWVYFAGAESVIEGSSVYRARLELGRRLGARVRALMDAGEASPDVVSPVPDTGRTAAMALAEEIGVPYRECFIKNRYAQRSFILGSQGARDGAVRRKLVPIKSEIEGKNVLLVDDSIVRGTTARRMTGVLRDLGAREVVLVSTCPPIRHGCYYGIDFPLAGELAAGGGGGDLGADRVLYMGLGDLEESLLPGRMCTGCLTGRYPTDTSAAGLFAEGRRRDRGEAAP